jgi:hypothetical protein
LLDLKSHLAQVQKWSAVMEALAARATAFQ